MMGRTKHPTNRIAEDSPRQRFSRHFPRLFAYTYGVTGDEEKATETTIASFSHVLNAQLLNEHDFTLALYTAARKLTSKQQAAIDDSLNDAEREVISLLFDAQLPRADVSELLGIDGEALLATLIGGLKKLRVETQSARLGHNLQTLSA
jgi:hypothetical protein